MAEVKNAVVEVVDTVRTRGTLSAFGITSTAFSTSMAGLKLAWDGKRIVMTHTGFPGQKRWIPEAAIEMIGWKEVPA